MSNKVDFLLVDKHKCFLQGDSITLRVHSQGCSKYSKKFTISLQYLKESVKDAVEFLPADKKH